MKNIHDHPPIALSNEIGNIFIDAFECSIEEVIHHAHESYLGFYSSKKIFAQEFWDELKEENMIDDASKSIGDFTDEIFCIMFKYKNGHVFCDNW